MLNLSLTRVLGRNVSSPCTGPFSVTAQLRDDGVVMLRSNHSRDLKHPSL